MKTQPLTETWRKEIETGKRLVFIYKINGEFIGEGALVLNAGDPDYTIKNQRIYVSRMIVKKEEAIMICDSIIEKNLSIEKLRDLENKSHQVKLL